MIDAIRNPIRRRSRSWFFASMSLAIAITVFLGFAPTFYLRPHFHPEPLPWLLVLHGLVFSLWIILVVFQTALLPANNTQLHRRLGIAGAVLAALVIPVGISTAILRTNVNAVQGHLLS